MNIEKYKIFHLVKLTERTQNINYCKMCHQNIREFKLCTRTSYVGFNKQSVNGCIKRIHNFIKKQASFVSRFNNNRYSERII